MANISKKEVVFNIVIPIITFLSGILGSYWLSQIDSESQIIKANKVNGENQKKIEKLPCVDSFLKFLDKIEEKDYRYMWNSMTPEYQRQLGNLKNLQYGWYLTNNYEVKFIIPISEHKSEHGSEYFFYFFLRFEDDVSRDEVGLFNKFTNVEKLSDISAKFSKIEKDSSNQTDSLKYKYLFIDEGLSEEMYHYIDERFVIEHPDSVKKKINEYICSSSMKTLVTRDWRSPIFIASDLQLEPKKNNIKIPYQRQGSYAIYEVIMEQKIEREKKGEWKVKKFETIALSRWQ